MSTRTGFLAESSQIYNGRCFEFSGIAWIQSTMRSWIQPLLLKFSFFASKTKRWQWLIFVAAWFPARKTPRSFIFSCFWVYSRVVGGVQCVLVDVCSRICWIFVSWTAWDANYICGFLLMFLKWVAWDSKDWEVHLLTSQNLRAHIIYPLAEGVDDSTRWMSQAELFTAMTVNSLRRFLISAWVFFDHSDQCHGTCGCVNI